MKYIGVDIGGTKCAVSLGNEQGEILQKIRFETTERDETIERIINTVKTVLDEAVAAGTPKDEIKAIGVSCGGPLDSKRGLILAPPNLSDWDKVEIVKILQEAFGLPAFLQNDADACALAEWKFGAGKGYQNLVFLTFGTGFGAGLILGGRLYTGGCNMAGEIGHVRLNFGEHEGYYKKGSYEGYCSGGGIEQYGYGSAQEIAQKAKEGDARAITIYKEVGENLGRAVSLLIDFLNPDAIIIGSIYTRVSELMEESMQNIIQQETLEISRKHCKILKAVLQESLGDVAAITVAVNGLEEGR